MCSYRTSAAHVSSRRFAPGAMPACQADAPPIAVGLQDDVSYPVRRSGPSVTQHLGDRGDGVPVARGDRDSEEPVERAEIADDLHVAPVHAEDEQVFPREDLQQPLAAG